MRTVLALCLFLTPPLAMAADVVLVQSTTSTRNSGLYDALIPLVEADTGLKVRVVAVGTGQALKNGRNCDADVVLVHAKAAEERFVAEGYGTRRTDLMYNDFVIAGPTSDPAKVKGSDPLKALSAISGGNWAFVSRGDDSGTHKAEMRLWAKTGTDPRPASGTWYRETGAGMGAALNISVAMGAYVLTDRASWITFRNKGDHQILVQGDPSLFNQYGIIPINPSACPNVHAKGAAMFVNWMLSARGQAAIADFRVSGQQLFFPNAPD